MFVPVEFTFDHTQANDGIVDTAQGLVVPGLDAAYYGWEIDQIESFESLTQIYGVLGVRSIGHTLFSPRKLDGYRSPEDPHPQFDVNDVTMDD